jgi:hypothetical protein
VRRRDHGAEDTAARRLEGDDRRRDDAEAVDGNAFARQPGDEGGFEHRRGHAGVAADHGLAAAEHARRRPAEVERERRREVGVGDAADAVGAELHGRRNRASRRAGRRISAW